jgi:hypothetical protein
MNDFLENLKNDIPQFSWTYNDITDSYFGISYIEPYKFKDKDKNTYINSNKIIFISGELYKGTENSFRYCTAYQLQRLRKYRCKFFNDIEGNKIYLSGKTLDIIYNKLFNNEKFIKFIIKN